MSAQTVSQNLYDLAARVGAALRDRQLKLVTAESCTGGWIAKIVTDIPGSSGWFDCGLITYSNTAKTALLGVAEATLERCGAVSAETVAEMAAGALQRGDAGIAVAVSGVAGPDGGSPDKPVGTVYLAWMLDDGLLHTECRHFPGDREAVRSQTVAAALEGLLDVLALRP
ncbi:MAG TPA: CinA family protein [Candidatus Competibacter sp.]|nr:damage-inducible protein CinA [Candidatus Competibacteraceae bacterium]HRE54409.1 CinA family protein [Candidatus Competibacter sp.]HUM93797.1 CinA family protein [Candidatus Competibacter sp.]